MAKCENCGTEKTLEEVKEFNMLFKRDGVKGYFCPSCGNFVKI